MSPHTHSSRFTTAPAFELLPIRREWCSPQDTIYFSFSNQFIGYYEYCPDEFFLKFFTFRPSAASLSVHNYGNTSLEVHFSLSVWNEPTTLEIEVSDLLEDQFNQHLYEHILDPEENKKARTFRFKVEPRTFPTKLYPVVSG